MQTFDTLNQVIAGPVACIYAGGRILMKNTGRKQVRGGERFVNRVQIYEDVFQAVREWQGWRCDIAETVGKPNDSHGETGVSSSNVG